MFYVTRSDGVMDVWDISHNQNEVAYSHKVSDAALSCISVEGNTQGGGKLVAVGDVNGTVSMLEVCDSLAQPQHNEKSAVGALLERESKKEKNQEVRSRELKRAKAQEEERKRKEKEESAHKVNTEVDEEMLELEKQFFAATSSDVLIRSPLSTRTSS